uniref:Uncharacterized protein n=1 Tax=Caenorhabditis japonica TaxID=281687 RepID=A0A8R1I7I2_CAEJA
MMHTSGGSGYNWYSTNSLKRYHAKNDRPTQYSDEGRVPLGSASDAENLQMRHKMLESVGEETLELWESYRKEMREKSLLAQHQLGLPVEEPSENLRTYPTKRHNFEEFEAEMGANSDTSTANAKTGQFGAYDRSKYVLNRKVNPLPVSTSSTTSTSASARTPEPISGILFRINTLTKNTLTCFQPAEKPLLTPATSSTKSPPQTDATTSSTPSSPIRECTLNKYGHCLDPAACEFAHNGALLKDEK